MDFTSSLKVKAQQIIELSNQLGDRTHTWNHEKSAPTGGYTDRTGFIVFDDLELFADVCMQEDTRESLLRARLAWSPKDEEDQDLFTIITLDFSVDLEKAKAIIADTGNLIQKTLVSLLNDPGTVPKLIQVSLESGKDHKGNQVGKRYEFSDEDLGELTEADHAEFLATIDQAYNQIVSKI